MNRVVRGLLLLGCMLSLSGHAETSAENRDTARRWLETSQQALGQLEPYGVYASYAATRIELAQARGFALLADVANTQSRLPYAGGEEPEWTSGGNGVVRMLLVSLELKELHATLLKELVAAGRTEEAFSYVAGLGVGQSEADVYLELGRVLETRGNLPQQNPANLTPQQQALVKIGVVATQLENQARGEARRVYKSIDNSEAAHAATQMTRLLILENDWHTTSEMLKLASFDTDTKAALVMEAIGIASRNGTIAEASKLVDTISGAGPSDALTAQVALAFSAGGDSRRAGEIFDGARTHDSGMWEQVALQTRRYDWLEGYYRALPSPWRRAERFYQWAKQRRDANEPREADRLAALSKLAAAEIPSPKTRWLAYRMLSEYYALAGNPAAALEMTRQIPADQADARIEREQADAQVAVAWAVTGDAQRAAQQAARITAANVRISALVMSAQHTRAHDPDAYEKLVVAARQECQLLTATEPRPAEGAWLTLVKMQLDTGDEPGAKTTAEQAAGGGVAGSAYESIMRHELEAGRIGKAFAAARAVPGGMDPGFGYDRQQHALGEVTVALAASGDGVGAAKLLAQIEQQAVRELNTPPVVRALVLQGDLERANALISGLKRGDALQNALVIVLFEVAQRRELPDPDLLNLVPRRRGGDLCWAAAASAQAGVAAFDDWLNKLDVAGCRAFAHAGAAFAVTAPEDDLEPTKLFETVDPNRVEERMALAMRRMAGGGNSR